MNKRQLWIERIKAVDREYQIAAAALSLMTAGIRTGKTTLPPPLAPADLQRTRENLETTYLMRLYALFEAGLRDAWQNFFGRESKPKTEDLLNSIAARRLVPEDDLKEAHLVRRYRNAVVHEGGEEAESVSIGQAASILCVFFSRLPLTW